MRFVRNDFLKTAQADGFKITVEMRLEMIP